MIFQMGGCVDKCCVCVDACAITWRMSTFCMHIVCIFLNKSDQRIIVPIEKCIDYKRTVIDYGVQSVIYTSLL